MLVDTSVWIDFFAGRDTPQVQHLEQTILDGGDITLCGIILTDAGQQLA